MPSVSFIVHLFFGFAFIYSIFWGISQKLRWQVLKSYFVGYGRSKVVVDKPLQAISRFAKALDIPFDGLGPTRSGRLVRINLFSLFELHLRYGICNLWYNSKDQNYSLDISTRVKINDACEFERRISKAFTLKVVIVSASTKS